MAKRTLSISVIALIAICVAGWLDRSNWPGRHPGALEKWEANWHANRSVVLNSRLPADLEPASTLGEVIEAMDSHDQVNAWAAWGAFKSNGASAGGDTELDPSIPLAGRTVEDVLLQMQAGTAWEETIAWDIIPDESRVTVLPLRLQYREVTTQVWDLRDILERPPLVRHWADRLLHGISTRKEREGQLIDAVQELDKRTWGATFDDSVTINNMNNLKTMPDGSSPNGIMLITVSDRTNAALLDAIWRIRATNFALGLVPTALGGLLIGSTTVVIVTRLLKHFRRLENRCANCGYDLRESPDRCPECGQPVEDGAAEPAPAG